METHAAFVGPLLAASMCALVARETFQGADQGPVPDPNPTPVVETLTEELDGGTGGLVVDAQGLVYCADFGSRLGVGSRGGDKLFRIDPQTGQAEIFARGLRGASGNAIRADGHIFQSSIGGGFITEISPDGSTSVFLSQGLKSPVGIAIDEEGSLFVANCGSGSIQGISKEGEMFPVAKSPLLSCPNGIALDQEHNFYVANFNNGNVIKIAWSGEVSKLATLPGNNNGHLVFHDGELFVVARGAHQIYRVSLEGEVSLFAGSGKRGHDNGPALEASFSFPNDLAFSPDGRTLYVNENASITEPHNVLAPMLVRKIQIPLSQDK